MNPQAQPVYALRIASSPNQPESLALCLRAILGWSGSHLDYSEICCALATAVMVSYCRTARLEDRWNTFGRHAFVEEAAREAGLELRALHPPQAAPTPPAPSEFEWHWRDSYMPLVRASLERGEPVLAWMGWPPPNDSDWGIITAIDNDGVARGVTPGCGNVPVRLAGPPVQVYCATRIDAQETLRHDRLKSMLTRFGRVLRNDLPEAFGVVTGVPALKALQGQPSVEIVQSAIKRMVSDRAGAGSVLLKFAVDADSRWRTRVERIADAINEQASFAERVDQSPQPDDIDKLIELEERIADLMP